MKTRRNAEARLIKLEEMVYFIEESVKKLDEEVRENRKQTENLERKLVSFRAAICQMKEQMAISGADDLPPHYLELLTRDKNFS